MTRTTSKKLMSPEDRLARSRFLTLMDQLAAERGVSERKVAEALDLDPSQIPQIRGDELRGVGGTVMRRVCAKLGISADYFAANSGDYRQFLRVAKVATPEDDEAWSLFLSRHKPSVAKLDPQVLLWIREAPFRGGPAKRAHGWSLALDAALALSEGKLPLDEAPPTSRGSR